MKESGQVIQIPIEDIIPNRYQPRISFDQKALEDLAKSIKQHGIIQPLVVRKIGDKYEIIAGERRYKASQIAGLINVPAIVSEMSDQESAEVALIENVQREDLSAIEEARSYQNILDKGTMTQEDLAKKMGLSQSSVANKLRLLNLPEDVQKAVLDGKISERHARSLLQIDDKNVQNELLNRIIDERLTVRQLDTIIKEMNNPVDDDAIDDVPLVDIDNNLDRIKSEATDINSFNYSNSSNNASSTSKGRFFNFDISSSDNTSKDFSNPMDMPVTNSSTSFFNFESTTPEKKEETQLLDNLDYQAPVVNDNIVEELLDTNVTPSEEIETLDINNTSIFETENNNFNNKINRVKDFINGLNIDNDITIDESDDPTEHKIIITIKKDF